MIDHTGSKKFDFYFLYRHEDIGHIVSIRDTMGETLCQQSWGSPIDLFIVFCYFFLLFVLYSIVVVLPQLVDFIHSTKVSLNFFLMKLLSGRTRKIGVLLQGLTKDFPTLTFVLHVINNFCQLQSTFLFSHIFFSFIKCLIRKKKNQLKMLLTSSFLFFLLNFSMRYKRFSELSKILNIYKHAKLI